MKTENKRTKGAKVFQHSMTTGGQVQKPSGFVVRAKAIEKTSQDEAQSSEMKSAWGSYAWHPQNPYAGYYPGPPPYGYYPPGPPNGQPAYGQMPPPQWPGHYPYPGFYGHMPPPQYPPQYPGPYGVPPYGQPPHGNFGQEEKPPKKEKKKRESETGDSKKPKKEKKSKRKDQDSPKVGYEGPEDWAGQHMGMYPPPPPPYYGHMPPMMGYYPPPHANPYGYWPGGQNFGPQGHPPAQEPANDNPEKRDSKSDKKRPSKKGTFNRNSGHPRPARDKSYKKNETSYEKKS